MSHLVLVPKQLKQEIKQVYDDFVLVEDERTYNWTSDCNACHRKIVWNHQVRHKTTKRCLPMEGEYHPGVVPRRHKCMFKGQGYWINKYDGTIEWDKDVKPDVDKVDERTKEIAVKRWRETVGYQPLNEYERANLEFSRKYYDTYKRMEEHSFEY